MILSYRLQIILVIMSVIFFLIIMSSSIKKKMSVRYFILWIILAFSFILMAIFPGAIEKVSKIILIREPVNLVYLIVNAGVILILFMYNYAISKLQSENRNLIQKYGILQRRVEDIEKSIMEEKKINDNN